MHSEASDVFNYSLYSGAGHTLHGFLLSESSNANEVTLTSGRQFVSALRKLLNNRLNSAFATPNEQIINVARSTVRARTGSMFHTHDHNYFVGINLIKIYNCKVRSNIMLLSCEPQRAPSAILCPRVL